MKKNAFTMIELIWVIVAIGILAGVAIPRLVGNRDDAKVAIEIDKLSSVIKNVGAHYIWHKSFPDVSTNASNLICFSLSTDASTKKLIVTEESPADATYCAKAHAKAIEQGLVTQTF